MKRSPLITLIAVVGAFVVIQGWIVYAKFHGHSSLNALHASLIREMISVGTPVSGIVQSVNVREGQHVEKGQVLFLISQQSPEEPNGANPIAVVAQRTGSIYNINVNAHSFVQASQVLAQIFDDSPDGLRIQATLSVDPEEFSSIVPSRLATVREHLLNDGEPIPAMVTSVGLYDGSTQTVDVQLRMLEPLSIPHVQFVSKLPVDVTLSDPSDKGDGTAHAAQSAAARARW